MCGISGVIDPTETIKVSEDLIQKMTSTVAHRGPDHMGTYIDSSFAFGHTRLSIIDISTQANQPMCDQSKEIFLTFNGEIFNFQELRLQLQSRGHCFTTNSDTEVVIYAYKEWGIECLQKFNGMFAFALYDKRNNEAFLVRDRFGIKPVYYLCQGKTLVFCSEIKGILAYPFYKRAVNIKAFSDFLSFRQTIWPETLFQDIFLLSPSSYLKLTQNKLEIVNYWKIKTTKERVLLKKEKGEVKRLIEDAIQKTLTSDVQLVSYLSGGVDSSVIAYEASKLAKIPTLTVCFQEEEYNESKYAKLLANSLALPHKEVLVERQDYLNHVKDLIRFKDQPLGMHNEVALYLLAKEARKEAKVALSGEGSDELFGGYGRIFRLPFEYYKRKIFKLASEDFFDFFMKSYTYFPNEEKVSFFNQYTKKALESRPSSYAQLRHIFEECPKASLYSKVFYFFQRFHLHGLLTMMDATSMATGLEVRFPFVDHRLVEAIFSLPTRYKLKWKSLFAFLRSLFNPPQSYGENYDQTKVLLKELYALDLPLEIIQRKKMVFPVPLREWFGGEFIEKTKELLLEKTSHCARYFDLEKLGVWIQENEQKPNDLYGRQLWLLLNLELWLREYFPQNDSPETVSV